MEWSVKIEIRPYTADLEGEVKAFNRRLVEAGVEFHFRLPETAASPLFPRLEGRKFFQERYLALEGPTVRGGYSMNRMEIAFRGEVVPVASSVEPIAEGTINKAYAMVGLELVRDAMKRSPMIYGLGIGGHGKPMARMFKALGWTLRTIPSYFRARRPYRVLRNLKPLRKTRLSALALDLAAISGVGWLGVKVYDAAHRLKGTRAEGGAVEPVDRFAEWADDLWRSCADRYSMIAVRDSHVLNILYPPGNREYMKMKISAQGRPVGWAVAMERQHADHRLFGDMRVGSIVDCLAPPESAAMVVQAAARAMEERGVDLIVSNQSHASWGRALQGAGFLAGPSECVFAASSALAEKLDSVDPDWSTLHVTRDGRPR